jgi:hypothetical protein
MATEMTEHEVWQKATHARCFMCNQKIELEGVMTVDDEGDIDELYDLIECCDDPSYELLIISDKPIFQSEEANDDAKISENPALGIYADEYHYTIGEDLMLAVTKDDE